MQVCCAEIRWQQQQRRAIRNCSWKTELRYHQPTQQHVLFAADHPACALEPLPVCCDCLGWCTRDGSVGWLRSRALQSTLSRQRG